MSDYIKKLYELAKVNNASLILKEKWIGSTMKVDCEFIEPYNFTAEKQLELIKWLAVHFEECKLCYDEDYKWCCQTYANSSYCCEKSEDSLADLIFSLWEELTEEQREEIKLILDTTKN